ncbi:hypothetical protein F5984_13080 [Rudanella paleaurantiibacter]|uniref:DUF4177 domain-containing protein n=1 Tax=Rudanella paleaurantiibacter TaxID=2614655 RepID=A0A7J5U0J5_9BACT|nr:MULTISPECIES: hypothetical protein [Rudanella]KAB7730110.1 hypothetical protein F5984_13080 [Rudanella paleaurantiibacter]
MNTKIVLALILIAGLAFYAYAKVEPQAAPAVRWQYKIWGYELRAGHGPSQEEYELNRLGQQGWEMVNFINEEQPGGPAGRRVYHVYHFKRMAP